MSYGRGIAPCIPDSWSMATGLAARSMGRLEDTARLHPRLGRPGPARDGILRRSQPVAVAPLGVEVHLRGHLRRGERGVVCETAMDADVVVLGLDQEGRRGLLGDAQRRE